MTNGKFLRQKSDPGLALWLAQRIRCKDCPIGNKCRQQLGSSLDSKSCPEMLLEWLEKEMNEDD